MDFKEVCCNIRSCLNSSKSQLSLTQLLRDYKEVLGEPLPFRPLGYNSAEALLRAVPNLRISNLRGEVFIDVKPDEKTAHIASLVREQRNSKKKKRKPIRGYQRGGAPLPPLRRPASIPPPRRSAPPPRDRSDYYPSYRRTSPPNQSYQRKPSPPRYTSYSNNSNNRNENYTNSRNENYSNSRNDNYSNNRNDNNYQRRRDSPPSTFTSQQNYRNSAPIEISSDEDNNFNNRNDQAKRVEEEIRRKYCPVPSQYNFSDSNEYNDDDGSDLEDCDEINSKMEELKVTLGNQRQVSINKPKFRSYPSNTSNEDDYGYSSMKTASKSGQRSGADHRSTMSRRYHRTMSSDSCECDDEEDYTTSSSTTTGAFDGHSHVFQATHSRQAFTPRPNRANVNVTEGYSQPQNKSRGRGLLLQNCNKKAPQTISRNTMPEIAEMGNIKVTLPNNSGRARVVNFLLR